MRLKLSIFLLCLPLVSAAQVWEKVIAPGLTYRMEYKGEIPIAIHALKFNPASEEVRALPELGKATVFEADATKGRETITALVQRTGAIAAINADYFPFTGDPLGLMVRSKEIVSRPFVGRCCFAWGKKGKFGEASLTAHMKDSAGAVTDLDGINEEAMPNKLVLNTPASGMALARNPNVHAVIKTVEGGLEVGGKAVGEVQWLLTDVTDVPIQPENMLLSGSGSKAAAVAKLRPGDRLTFTSTTTGFDWGEVEHAVGGGPWLVKGGATYVDAEKQGFKPDFYKGKHPRTAVGRTAKGDIWFVAVDGRQKVSTGLTLSEMSGVMIKLGCVEAINLDGGGSTALNIFGMTVNRPSGGSERAVANAIAFYGPSPTATEAPMSIQMPETVFAGEVKSLKVLKADGSEVPHTDVLWRASGSGWVDQGGTCRFYSEGEARIEAMVGGRVVSASVFVLPKPEPIPPNRRAKARAEKRR